MSVIPKITCRRCGREYSGLRSRCPYCGTGRSRSAERIPLRTSSENAGTPAAEHAAVNTKWQMLFGGILLLAVVAAVIVLITVSLNASQNPPSVAEPTPPATVSSAAPVATPTPTPEPTPTPTPTPSVTSITITFLGSKRTEFAAKVGDEVPLSTTIYPAGGNQTVTWSSKDESIATVSDKGVGFRFALSFSRAMCALRSLFSDSRARILDCAIRTASCALSRSYMICQDAPDLFL